MLVWNLYFLIKLGLHAGGVLVLHPWLNLVLFGLLVLTSPLRRKLGWWFGALRDLALVAPATALMLHELGLVVSWALIDQIRQLFGFSPQYLWELAQRSVAPWQLWVIAAAYLLVRVLNRYLRISTWVFCGVLGVSLVQGVNAQREQVQAFLAKGRQEQPLATGRENDSPAELLALGRRDYEALSALRERNLGATADAQGNTPDGVLKSFFDAQQHLAAQALHSLPSTPGFDVLILQVCSMSWADLQVARQTQHPLLRGADFVFDHFNSATSYSGPAAIRLLRGRCGQGDHKSLYSPAHEGCQLFGQLQQAGYAVEMGMNHNGTFDNFRQLVKGNLGATVPDPLSHTAVPAGVQAFDGSAVGRDGDYLRTWWSRRLSSNKPAVALYYNTITLHDGNVLPGSRQDSLSTYPLRVERLLTDIQSLIADIRTSGRRALVLVVPEHGAGLSGEFGQLVGLRELPTPGITRVPVIGYWVSPTARAAGEPRSPVNIKQPSSYLALSELLGRVLQADAQKQADPAWPVLLNDLPATRHVAQQGNITVMEYRESFWLKAPGTDWRVLGPAERAALPDKPVAEAP